MPKYYRRYAEEHVKPQKPDLQAGLRAFVQQQNQTVAAAKEQNLRIKTNEERWLNQKEKSNAKSLQNLTDLNNFESQKAETRRRAITVRRDTEVARLEGEAKLLEEKSKNIMEFSRTAGKNFSKLALGIHEQLDKRHDKKVWDEILKTDQLKVLEQSQILKNAKGLAALNESDLKQEAHSKGDYEDLKYITYRGQRVRNNRYLLTYYKENRESLYSSFNEYIASFPEDIELNKNNISKLFIERGREIAKQMGFDPLSEEGLYIVNDWVSRATSARATLANAQANGEREDAWKQDMALVKDDPSEINLNNLITNNLTINYEWDAAKNEFKLKPKEYHVGVKEIGLKAFKQMASFDKYHKMGRTAGWAQFREDTIEHNSPHRLVETPMPWLVRHQDIEEEVYNLFIEANNAWAKNIEDGKKETDASYAATLELRLEDPTHPEYIDISTREGISALAELYKEVPGTKSQKVITEAINYDVADSNYSVEKHIELLDASINDPTGFLYLLNTIDKKYHKRYELKGKVAKVLETSNMTYDSVYDRIESEAKDYTLNENLAIGQTIHHSTAKRVERSTQEFYYLVNKNISLLDTPEYNGDMESYAEAMLDLTVQNMKNPSLNPIIEVGGDDSFAGQESIVFANEYKGDTTKQTPKTYDNWYSMLVNSYNKETEEHEMKIQDLIDKDVVLTDRQVNNIIREIESGGGGDNSIILSGDLKHLANLEAKWTARDIVNAVLEKKGFKHRLPPDRQTMTKWIGYDGPKPQPVDETTILFMQQVINQAGQLGIPLPRDLQVDSFVKGVDSYISKTEELHQPLVMYNPATGKREAIVS